MFVNIVEVQKVCLTGNSTMMKLSHWQVMAGLDFALESITDACARAPTGAHWILLQHGGLR